MRNNMKQHRLIFFLLVVALLVFSFAGCREAIEEGQESSAASRDAVQIDYRLCFMTEGGMILPNLLVKVYEDHTLSEMVYAAMTDREGVLCFTADDSESYVAVVYMDEAGYFPESSYSITEKDSVLCVKTAPYQVTDTSELSLKLGHIIPDFHVTCTDGTVLTISDLLASKKAVVLNFWYIGCGPCRMEFPYLQKAYESYCEQLEVIAINPYDGTDETAAAYAEELGLTFPVAAEASYWQTIMNLRAYPTTIVIDRYGMICLVHDAAITDTESFEKLFAFITSDDYVQEKYLTIEAMKP